MDSGRVAQGKKEKGKSSMSAIFQNTGLVGHPFSRASALLPHLC